MSIFTAEEENFIISQNCNKVSTTRISRNFCKEFGFNTRFLSLKRAHFQFIIDTFKENGVTLRDRSKQNGGRNKKPRSYPKYLRIIELFTQNPNPFLSLFFVLMLTLSSQYWVAVNKQELMLKERQISKQNPASRPIQAKISNFCTRKPNVTHFATIWQFQLFWNRFFSRCNLEMKKKLDKQLTL